MFIDYLNMRGGKVQLSKLEPPNIEGMTPLEAFQRSLQMEKSVYKSLLELHDLSAKKDDPSLTDFLEGEFIEGQVADLKKVSDKVTILKRVGDGTGLYLFDQQIGGGAGGGAGGAGGPPVV